jgi:hypothetical protein
VASSSASWSALFQGRRLVYTLLLTFSIGVHAIGIHMLAMVLPSIVADLGGAAFYAWATLLYTIASIIGTVCGGFVTARLNLRRGWPVRCRSASASCVACAAKRRMGQCEGRQALRAMRQRGGQRIATSATHRRLIRFILLVGLGHQGFDRFAQPCHLLLPIAVTHRLVTRGIPLHCRASRRHVAPLHQPRLPRPAPHRHTGGFPRLHMLLTKGADGTKIRALLAYDRHKSPVAFARQRDLTARKYPPLYADNHRHTIIAGSKGGAPRVSCS